MAHQRGVEIVGNTATELNGRRVGHIYKNVFPHRNFIEANAENYLG